MVQSAQKLLIVDGFISHYGECDRYELIEGSHSNVLQYYIARCRGTAVPIGVNLSKNAYPTGVLPHPSFGFRQNWGGVTRIMMRK